MKITTCHWCTWSRRNFEHCAQRRSPVAFEASNPPEIAPFGSWSSSRNFSKILIFHEKSEISWHASKIYSRSNFFHWIFWKLSCSKSESSYKTVVLDKGKDQTTVRIRSTTQKTNQKSQIVTSHDWPRFATGGRKVLLKTASFMESRLYKPYWIWN